MGKVFEAQRISNSNSNNISGVFYYNAGVLKANNKYNFTSSFLELSCNIVIFSSTWAGTDPHTAGSGYTYEPYSCIHNFNILKFLLNRQDHITIDFPALNGYYYSPYKIDIYNTYFMWSYQNGNNDLYEFSIVYN